MKIVMFLATGMLLTFPAEKYKAFDCHDQGYRVLEKIATYHGPGPTQGNFTRDGKLMIGYICS